MNRYISPAITCSFITAVLPFAFSLLEPHSPGVGGFSGFATILHWFLVLPMVLLLNFAVAQEPADSYREAFGRAIGVTIFVVGTCWIGLIAVGGLLLS